MMRDLTGVAPPSEVTEAMLRWISRSVAPQAVYVANLETLSKQVPNLLDVVRFSGWRYMVLTGQDTAIAALVDKRSDGTYAVTGVTTGPGICKAIRAAQYLRTLPDLGEYEIRALSIPALSIDCLWLKRTGAPDKIVPYSDHGSFVELKKQYPVEEFVIAIANAALQRWECKSGPEHATPLAEDPEQ